MANYTMSNFTFHNGATQIGNGNILTITRDMSSANIQFISTGTFETQIEAQVIDSNIWYPYPCFKLPTYELITSTITDSGFIYNIDLTAISKLRIRLINVSGTLSVYGKVVS